MAATPSPQCNRFPKSSRLRTSAEFKKISISSMQRVGKHLVLCYRFSSKNTQAKLGITASRRFGKAHERNLFKRRVREAFRQVAGALPPTIEINVLPRKEALEATIGDLQREFISLPSPPSAL